MLKKVIAFLLISSLSLSFVACKEKDPKVDPTAAPNADKTDAPVEPATVKGNIDFWLMPNSAAPDQDLLGACKAFLDKNPEVTITPTVIDWGSAWTKITAAATSGEAPDITQLGTTWVGAITYMDALADMTDKVDWSKFTDATLVTSGLMGETKKTAAPWFCETRALFYRTDACEKAGVDPSKDFATWDSYKEALKKLNGVEIDGKKLPALGMPGKNDWNVVHNFAPWIYGGGGDYLSADGKTAAFNSPEALEGIKFYSELAVEGLMDKASLEKNTSDVESAFVNGGYATSILGPWNITTLETNKKKFEANPAEGNALVDKVGVVAIPAGPKERKAFLGGSTLAIFESSKNQDASFALVNYLTDTEAQVAYATVTGNLPTNKEAYADPIFSEHPMRKVFKDQMEFAKAYPSIASWGPSETYFQQGLSKIWDNAMEVGGKYNWDKSKAAIEEVIGQVNTVIEQNKVQ